MAAVVAEPAAIWKLEISAGEYVKLHSTPDIEFPPLAMDNGNDMAEPELPAPLAKVSEMLWA